MTIQHINAIALVNVAHLVPHPDNRPLGINEEKVEQLAAIMQATGYDQSKPIKVRPHPEQSGKFQIIEGEHRWRAAQRADIADVPVFVVDVDDEEALIQLVAGNTQTDNHPLDIGIAALKVISSYNQSGRSAKSFGERIGLHPQSIQRYTRAAKVWNETKNNTGVVLQEIAILEEISKCQEPDWLWFYNLAASKDLTKNEVIEISKRIRAIDEAAAPGFSSTILDIQATKQEVATAKDRVFNDRLSLIQGIEECAGNLDESWMLYRYDIGQKTVIEYQYKARETFLKKLSAFKDLTRQQVFEQYNATLKTKQQQTKENAEREREYYQDEVNKSEAEARARAEWEAFMPVPGTWYELGRHRLYCGDNQDKEFISALPKAALAFADPPYNAGVDEWDKGFEWEQDYLIDVADIVTVTPGIGNVDAFFKATKMPYKWSLSTWIKNGMTRGAVGFGNWIFTAVFSRLESIHKNAQDFNAITIKTADSEDHYHRGRKPGEYMRHIIELFTKEGDSVIDNFLGSGTTLLECEQLNRTCYGAEKSPEFCKEIMKFFKDLTNGGNSI